MISNQEKIERFRKLNDKILTLTSRVRSDMRQIRTIISKEKRRNDCCLVSIVAEDCADLELLAEKLVKEERRL